MHDLIFRAQQHYDVSAVILLTLDTSRLRLREDRSCSQGHSAGLNPDMSESRTYAPVNAVETLRWEISQEGQGLLECLLGDIWSRL